jgi:undecaprenyl diphosphate synthase
MRFPGIHAAVIMDGNGRWATARGRPRAMGHRAGAAAVRRVVEAAPELGIGTLTLYAFSADNWGRPPREVSALMRLFRAYLAAETQRCLESGVRMSVIGRRDRLPGVLVRAIAAAEEDTAGGTRLHLRLALDYSARDAIVRAASLALASTSASRGASADYLASPASADPVRSIESGGSRWMGGRSSTGNVGEIGTGDADAVARAEFARLLGAAMHAGEPAPDVDLLIRTGGEQRLSDFLLWECAYAELLFSPRMWPDFDAAALAEAVAEFRGRERRFGRVPTAAAG